MTPVMDQGKCVRQNASAERLEIPVGLIYVQGELSEPRKLIHAEVVVLVMNSKSNASTMVGSIAAVNNNKSSVAARVDIECFKI